MNKQYETTKQRKSGLRAKKNDHNIKKNTQL